MCQLACKHKPAYSSKSNEECLLPSTWPRDTSALAHVLCEQSHLTPLLGFYHPLPPNTATTSVEYANARRDVKSEPADTFDARLDAVTSKITG
jgi:hypothetical protein